MNNQRQPYRPQFTNELLNSSFKDNQSPRNDRYDLHKNCKIKVYFYIGTIIKFDSNLSRGNTSDGNYYSFIATSKQENTSPNKLTSLPSSYRCLRESKSKAGRNSINISDIPNYQSVSPYKPNTKDYHATEGDINKILDKEFVTFKDEKHEQFEFQNNVSEIFEPEILSGKQINILPNI